MVDNSEHIVTAAEVADATGQSIEAVAREWHTLFAEPDQNS